MSREICGAGDKPFLKELFRDRLRFLATAACHIELDQLSYPHPALRKIQSYIIFSTASVLYKILITPNGRKAVWGRESR
jgi:hypothetical protein